MTAPTAARSCPGAKWSPAQATETAVTPGMRSPCAARSATSSGKLLAAAQASVGRTSSASDPTITAFLPSASESGPARNDPAAMASTTAETESPAVAGGMANSAESMGRSGWVTYMAA